MLEWLLTSAVAFCAFGPPVPAADPARGLVAYWGFDEGKGDILHDSTGNGNHGKIHGAEWVKCGKGYALRFDGKDDYVDCGTDESLDIGSSGTAMIWCCPKAHQGGLINWSTGTAWVDERLALGFDTYSGGHDLIIAMADGKSWRRHWLEEPLKDVWNHVALTWDCRRIILYRDGVRRQTLSMPIRPDLRGVPFWIGKCLGLGKDYFEGLVGEVRLYNRPLSPEEVFASFKRKAASLGKDVTLFSRPQISVEALPDPGLIAVRAECGLMKPLPEGAAVEVSVRHSERDGALGRGAEKIVGHSPETTVSVDAGNLRPGSYSVSVSVKDADGRMFGSPSGQIVEWPGRTQVFKNVKVLNNICWEVLNERLGLVTGTKKYEFLQPKRRWVYVRCTADAPKARLSVSIDSAAETKDIIVFDRTALNTQEAMRFMPAGEHTLTLRCDARCRVEDLTVRSVPVLAYSRLQADPYVKENGPLVGDFLEKHVFPNVNTFVVSSGLLKRPFFLKLEGRGRQWLAGTRVLWPAKDKPLTAAQVCDYFLRTPGLTNPVLHGAIGDEFGHSKPMCGVYARAWRKMHTDPRIAGRIYVPYAGDFYTGHDGREFTKALVETGSAFAWKRYLPGAPDEQSARDMARHALVTVGRRYRDLCPGSIEHMIVCFGYFSAPPEFLNVYPQGNYKKYLDIQLNLVANDPVYWGAYGLMSYHSSYVDREVANWMGHVFRHYGIEGNSDPASDDPYESPHLVNGDFADGTTGWTLRPAEKGGIRTDHHPGFGWLQGRYPATPAGDTVLVTVRSARKPNVFAQEVRNLVPGRLYTFRMFTADYKDMSKKEKHMVTVALENATTIPEKSFVAVFPNHSSHRYGEYTGKRSAWINYHWTLFRAGATTARLTISDWATPQPQGRGPATAGQEIMYNFIQVHPYYGP